MKKSKPRHPRQSSTTTRARTSGIFVVAVTLANDTAAFMAADDEHRQDLLHAALAVGEWLAHVKRPGRWDTLEVAKVLDLLPPGPPRERDRFLMTLVGLLGFAALDGRLDEEPAARSMREIATLTEDPNIQAFASQTAARLLVPEGLVPTGDPHSVS